jgi:MFS transporter, OFA family, oxalate/formate antiporter
LHTCESIAFDFRKPSARAAMSSVAAEALDAAIDYSYRPSVGPHLPAEVAAEFVLHAETSSASEASAPARLKFFYGWLMVPLATVVMIASAPGQTYGFMFFNPLIRESLALSQTQLSATYLLATLCAAMPLSFLGGLSDKYGIKRSLLVAVTAMAGACLLASAVQSAAMLFVAFLGLRMIGAGLMSLLATNTLAVWFDRRLGLACGLMQFGMALSVALVPIGLMALIGVVGWRNAYVVLGMGLVLGLLPLLVVAYRGHPCEVGQLVDGDEPPCAHNTGAAGLRAGGPPLRVVSELEPPSLNLGEAMRTSVFWLLITATAVWSLIGTGLMFHLESLLGACSLTRSQAAWATPLMALAMAAVQLGSGVLVDRFPIRWLISGALGCVAIGCAVLATTCGPAALAAYGVYGAGQGLMTVVSSASWARYFGPAHLGRIRGTAMTVGIACSALGPLVMGASVDCLGGFEPSLWLFAAVALIVAAAGRGVE